MFHKKIDEIFKELPSVFGIADDILLAGYNDKSTDHDQTLYRVLQICRKEHLKLNKISISHAQVSLSLMKLFPDMA